MLSKNRTVSGGSAWFTVNVSPKAARNCVSVKARPLMLDLSRAIPPLGAGLLNRGVRLGGDVRQDDRHAPARDRAD